MRTTITLDDGLLEDLKRVARERGKTLSAVIEEATRRFFAEIEAEARLPRALPPLLVVGDPNGPKVSAEAVQRAMDDLHESEAAWSWRPRG